MSMVMTGIAAGAQTALGIGQMVFSGKNKANKALDAQVNNNPMMMGNKGIADYYEQQKSRANANQYQSASYLNSMKNVDLSTASGLAALQDRGSSIGGVARLVAMKNQASGNAIGQAENLSNAAQGRYGQAVGMKASDDRAVWNNNVLDPYTRKLQLAQMKAKAANDTFNNGISMIGNAAGNITSVGAAKAGGYNPKSTKNLGNPYGTGNVENY